MMEHMFFGTVCLIYAVIFIVWIFLAIWVYNDAKRRGENGALWLIIVILTGVIGLIVWLVVRPPLQPQHLQAYQQPYTQPQQAVGQPYAQGQQSYACPYCRSALVYVPQYGRYYCQRCNRYV